LIIGVVVAGYGHALDPGEQAAYVGGGGYLIQNAALVLTMDPHRGDGSILGQLEHADVLIVGDQIAAVEVNLAAPSGVHVIDGRGMIVMPGFVDTHDHLWQCLIRGCATDGHLFQWLGRCVFPLRGSPISEDDGYAGTRLATAGLINTGVTTVVDWNHDHNVGFARGSLRALNDSHLRYAFAMVLGTSDGADVKAAKAQFIDPNPLARLQIGARTFPRRSPRSRPRSRRISEGSSFTFTSTSTSPSRRTTRSARWRPPVPSTSAGTSCSPTSST